MHFPSLHLSLSSFALFKPIDLCAAPAPTFGMPEKPGDTPSSSGEEGKRRAENVANIATPANKKPHVAGNAPHGAPDAAAGVAAGVAAGAAVAADIPVRYVRVGVRAFYISILTTALAPSVCNNLRT